MKKKKLLVPSLSTIALATALFSVNAQADEIVATDVASTDVTLAVETASSEASPLSVDIVSVSESASSEVNPASTATSESTEVATSELTQATASSLTAVSETSETIASDSSSDEMVILHTNDMHGRIEEAKGVIGVAKEATIVAEECAKDQTTIVVDAGDAFQGLPITNSSKGEDVAKIMNEIGYDAMTLGNHEFDFGLDQLKKLDELLTFPLISSNVYVNGARLFEASTVIDKNKEIVGDEVVVIGVTTPETATKTHPKNVEGVTFTDPISEVETVIAEIEARAKATGANYKRYIILAHLGIDTTTPVEWQGKTLAEALSKNSLLSDKQVVVIDGHSHTLESATYGNVTYNQTGSYLNNLGKITLNSDRVLAGVISASETADVTANEKVAALVADAKARLEAENAVVIVENNSVELNGERTNVRVRETNLGNAVADALWTYGQTGFAHKTNLAVTNGGGLRETIKKDAPITRGDIVAVLPFGNSISQITVTGQQIKEMFVKSLGSILQVNADGGSVLDENGRPLLEASGGFLQVSGAKVYYDTALDPESRILAIQIYDHDTASYLDLDLDKTYYLATNDFLAAGGDGYTMLGGPREEGPSMDTIFADYLAAADLSQYQVVNPNSRTISVDSQLDTDQDGFVDYLEVIAGTNHTDQNDYPGKVTDTTNNSQTDPIQTVTQKDSTSSGVTYTKSSSHGTARPYVQQTLNYSTNATQTSVKTLAVPVTYVTSPKENQLPLTNSKESALAILLGVSLTTYGLYAIRKKSV
ncbi:cell surface ecto-5'-nucleotidase Nt5e [Streptococcus sp.]|nr:cell surface ecto-5'-nucleotidase Nt5e [Streptococcus sp.]